jgi:hypothetical protein
MLFDSELGAIAPTALATGLNIAAKTLTIADATLYHNSDDTTDADHFAAGYKVVIVGKASPFYVFHGTLAGVTALATNAVLSLVASPGVLTTAMMPVYVTYDFYTTCTTEQTAAGWAWIAADGDGEVLDQRVGWRWGA